MNKGFLLFAVLLMLSLNGKAQGFAEVEQYGQQDIFGTARYRSMSGAFGALGGDLSAMSDNPAGSAVFLNSFGSVTLSGGRLTNEASYFGTTYNENTSLLNFNQLGAVLVLKNADEASSFNKLTFGVNYNQTADNEGFFRAIGTSPNSLSDVFVDGANGIALNELKRSYDYVGATYGFLAQQASLAYEALIIDSVDGTNTSDEYVSNFGTADTNAFEQEYTVESTGLNGKLVLNLAAQFDTNYYAGVNLNFHSLNYTRLTNLFETIPEEEALEFDVSGANEAVRFTEIDYQQRLRSTGSGFSANFGTIAKVSDNFRVGLSYETPTWFIITDEVSERLGSSLAFISSPAPSTILPDYRLRTPGKVTGSMAILFGKQGLISVDYFYKDYREAKLSTVDGFEDDFDEVNSGIDDAFQATSNVRIGGEFRFQNWSYRAGYRYEQNPYADANFGGDVQGYSLGLGYNFGKIKLDLAYDRREQEQSTELFPGLGYNNVVDRSVSQNSFTATLGLNF